MASKIRFGYHFNHDPSGQRKPAPPLTCLVTLNTLNPHKINQTDIRSFASYYIGTLKSGFWRSYQKRMFLRKMDFW